ncbi:hypothetical protein INR49_028608 [Caranx melampygus]|nr:hypothetical protein INR49_028608 [Caranx melampygus]
MQHLQLMNPLLSAMIVVLSEYIITDGSCVQRREMGTSSATDVVVVAVQVCGRPAGGSHPGNEQHVQQQKMRVSVSLTLTLSLSLLVFLSQLNQDVFPNISQPVERRNHQGLMGTFSLSPPPRDGLQNDWVQW